MNVHTEVVATIATAIVLSELSIHEPGSSSHSHGSANCRNRGGGKSDRYRLCKLALAKSKNKQIRAFAQQMVTDHSALQNRYSILARN